MELVLYMPLLMFVIFLAVQFALIWFGNQAASAVARETARTARVYESEGQAVAAGRQYAATIGDGVLEHNTSRGPCHASAALTASGAIFQSRAWQARRARGRGR